MIERKVYQCEHCKKFRRTPKIYFSRDHMHTHECVCYYNLENRSCYTCIHNIHQERYENKCQINHSKENKAFVGDMTLVPIKHCDDWEPITAEDNEFDEGFWKE